MPQLQVTTQDAKEVWKSPDGQRILYEVYLNHQGQTVKAKSYSKAIATPGFSGDVETYEKQGNKGIETFVKQPQREGFTPYQGSQKTAQPAAGGGKKFGGESNPYTMYLSYAKDLLVALVMSGTYDPDLYRQLLEKATEGGDFLHLHGSGEKKELPEPSKDELNELFKDSTDFFVDGEKIPFIEDN